MAVAVTFALVTPVVLMPPAAAAATSVNPVIVWDINAQTAIWDVAGQQPANVAGRSFAMVSGAVYDAVNAIAGVPYQPYLVAPRASGHESTDAAVGTAAYRVLTALFPQQQERLREQYEQWLAAIPDGRSKRGGVRVGDQAAAAMITARENDGAFGDQLWPVGTEPGQWRPTPPGFTNDGAWFAHLKPFVIPENSRFDLPGPPALTSRTYARDVNEIQRIGSATSTVRTPDQTDAARWWHDRRSPAWEIKRQLATSQRLSPLRTARLFAIAEMVSTDAGIICGKIREATSFWRPITAIQLADTDGNPRTIPDPDWTPLLTTPAQPDYPSGNTCGNGARLTAYATFFGRNDIAFSGFSQSTGTTRHFTSFSQALTEVIGARIWGGIHFRTACVDGAKLGSAVGRYITGHYFQPRG